MNIWWLFFWFFLLTGMFPMAIICLIMAVTWKEPS